MKRWLGIYFLSHPFAAFDLKVLFAHHSDDFWIGKRELSAVIEPHFIFELNPQYNVRRAIQE